VSKQADKLKAKEVKDQRRSLLEKMTSNAEWKNWLAK